jgi:predicted PurR-regulated permease PerM
LSPQVVAGRSPLDLAKLVAAIVVIAVLYFGQTVLMPFALAMLISFSLAPLVDRVERWRIGRAPAVIVVCLLIASFLGGVGWIVGRQATQLAADVPQYRSIVREKLRELRGPIGSIAGAAEEITELGQTIQPGGAEAAPPKVEVVDKPNALGTLGDLFALLAGPLGTIGLVAVLALFMLLEREELRDRMIWLLGAGDLSVTTRALDDATQRVSRYLGMQSLVNATQGVAVTIGLLAIGVPGAVLWGALSAVLRFLPYFGPWIAASIPVLLSIVTFHGWTQPLLTVALFVGIELVTNNGLEPWLYGSSVGLSPFGVIFSAVFWASLWGIPGLLVATPLTVCLVVAGRYARGFEIFPVLLGDQPALPIDVRLYQRLLAFDWEEAREVLREAADADGIDDDFSDLVVLPVLRRLAEDDQRDAVPDATTNEVRTRLGELLEEIAEAAVVPAPTAATRARVLFVPALDESDALAGRWLARTQRAQGIDASFASPHSLASELVEQIAAEAPAVVCVSALTPRGTAQARHLCKRLARANVDGERVIGVWAAPGYVRPAPSEDFTAAVATARELSAVLQSARARGAAVEVPFLRRADRNTA